MEKGEFSKQFSSRLHDSMIAAGMSSKRSTSGVCIHELAKITGYSVQICRKYLRGEAIPEPLKLSEIAKKLGVLPGWLLFGDSIETGSNQRDSITINKELLRHIFKKTHEISPFLLNESVDAIEFLMGIINEIATIDIDVDHLKKIIDLSFKSAAHFNPSLR